MAMFFGDNILLYRYTEGGVHGLCEAWSFCGRAACAVHGVVMLKDVRILSTRSSLVLEETREALEEVKRFVLESKQAQTVEGMQKPNH